MVGKTVAQSLVLLVATAVASAKINITTPPLGFPPSMEHLWAQSSPWFAVQPYSAPPHGCEIVQVNLLERHGARYPTSGSGKDMAEAVAKMKNATKYTNPQFDFITTYNYDLQNNGDLVLYGAQQSYDSGEVYYTRYASLVNASMIPFVRASSSERVVASAGNWTLGFAYASNQQYQPMLNVILYESTNNDTLNNDCPDAPSSNNQTDAWQDVFTPSIVDSFNAGAPGANLTGSDIVKLMSLCSYDTMANEAPSPWCDLFTMDQWTSYEYYQDLGDYYGNGYGNPLGPVQGVGWINELIARLTGQPVQDETQTNHTLDDSPATFPLNRTIYADFTHDDEMISIFSAMGLYNQSAPLNPVQPNPDRTWIVSQMVPFAARMAVEKLSCNGGAYEEGQEYMRILVNDEVQPLAFCGGNSAGLCTVSNFVESQTFARNNGDGLWAMCFATSK